MEEIGSLKESLQRLQARLIEAGAISTATVTLHSNEDDSPHSDEADDDTGQSDKKYSTS